MSVSWVSVYEEVVQRAPLVSDDDQAFLEDRISADQYLVKSLDSATEELQFTLDNQHGRDFRVARVFDLLTISSTFLVSGLLLIMHRRPGVAIVLLVATGLVSASLAYRVTMARKVRRDAIDQARVSVGRIGRSERPSRRRTRLQEIEGREHRKRMASLSVGKGAAGGDLPIPRGSARPWSYMTDSAARLSKRLPSRRRLDMFISGASRLLDVTGLSHGRRRSSDPSNLVRRAAFDLGRALGNPPLGIDLTGGKATSAIDLAEAHIPQRRREQ